MHFALFSHHTKIKDVRKFIYKILIMKNIIIRIIFFVLLTFIVNVQVPGYITVNSFFVNNIVNSITYLLYQLLYPIKITRFQKIATL